MRFWSLWAGARFITFRLWFKCYISSQGAWLMLVVKFIEIYELLLPA